MAANVNKSDDKKGKKRRVWKPKFIEALATDGSVKTALMAAGIGRTAAYAAYQNDKAFAAEWDSAVEEAVESMEREAYRRAVCGTEKPVFHQGAECGRIREYSDTLLIFLMKAGKPEKYREAKGDININVENDRLAADPEVARAAREAAVATIKLRSGK